MKFVSSAAIALLLTLGVVWGGVALSGWVNGAVRESTAYRQSQIISSVFSEESDVGLGAVLADRQARDLLIEFARALMSAYVSFELIPYGQFETFGVVYSSLGQAVEIDSFAYRGHDLIITGFAPDEESYLEFLSGLEGSGHFLAVSGSFRLENDKVHFEIVCISAIGQGAHI